MSGTVDSKPDEIIDLGAVSENSNLPISKTAGSGSDVSGVEYEPGNLLQPAPSEDSRAAVSEAREPDIGAQITRLEESLTSRLVELLKVFQDKLAFDRFKEDQITRLHDELQGYKADLLIKTARPFISGVIRLHDDISNVLDALRKRPPEELTPERFFKVIEGFQGDLELILGQNGIDAFSEPEDSFKPQRQKALTTIPTLDASMAGRVAERLRPGFEQGSTIFQKERVAVYVSASPESSPPEPKNREAQDARIEGENR